MTLYNIAKKIVQKFVDHGHVAYFAGGWVRDFLMKHPSNDIDIVTSASVEETQKLFSKTIPVGINFGILIVVEEGHHFEVAIFRKESGFSDGRRPDSVEVAEPKEDALRRDFTINGMFYDPLKEELFDYVGGQKDLQIGVVRAIGNPHERFLEDRLRMIRAVRYASRFRFAIDPKTIEAIIFHAEELFPAVAIERAQQELEKMAKISHFDEALVMLHRFNLLQTIFPALSPLGIEEIEERVRYIQEFPLETPLIGKLCELFPKSSLEQKIALCETLKLSNKDRKFIEELHKWEQMENLDLYELAQIYALPHALVCLKITSLQKKSSAFFELHKTQIRNLEPAINRIKENRTIVTSQDLIKLGIKPSKELGALLQKAERIAINNSLDKPFEIIKQLNL